MAAKDIEAGRAHVLLRIRNLLSQGLKIAEASLLRFARVVSAVGGAVATSGAGFGAWALKLSSDMEQNQVAFTVFLGSAEKAKKLLRDIEQLAARTPFQFQELADNTKLLLNFGVKLEDVIPAMQMLGDVSAGNSERFEKLSLAYGQVISKGRLMGQEANQMTEQGFSPLRTIADELSRTFGDTSDKYMPDLMKAMEDGKISAEMVSNAFRVATSEGGRFNNAMKMQSQTLQGLVSTFIDYSKMAARVVGDALLEPAKAIVQVGIGFMQTTAVIAQVSSQMFSLGVGVLSLYVKNFGTAMGYVGQYLEGLFKTAEKVVEIVGVAFGGFGKALMNGDLSTAASIAFGQMELVIVQILNKIQATFMVWLAEMSQKLRQFSGGTIKVGFGLSDVAKFAGEAGKKELAIQQRIDALNQKSNRQFVNPVTGLGIAAQVTGEGFKSFVPDIFPDMKKAFEEAKTLAQNPFGSLLDGKQSFRSVGTFSAAGAALLANGNDAGRQTATNTRQMVQLMKDAQRKKGPVFQ